MSHVSGESESEALGGHGHEIQPACFQYRVEGTVDPPNATCAASISIQPACYQNRVEGTVDPPNSTCAASISIKTACFIIVLKEQKLPCRM